MTDISVIILELIENSLESGAGNIRVHIAENESSDEAVTVTASVVVIDDGRGMTEEEIGRAMRGGYSTKTTETEGASTGRGIAKCRALAESICGSLVIKSGKDGAGTTVTLTLPMTENVMLGDIASTAMTSSCGAAGVRIVLSHETPRGGYELAFDTGASAEEALYVEKYVRERELDIRRK